MTKTPVILEILGMDGRKRAPEVSPLAPIMGRRPSVTAIKNVIRAFDRTGGSNHSGMRLLLPYVLAYCEAKGYSYNLECYVDSGGRTRGYYLKKIILPHVFEPLIKVSATK
jgi:hypothetical protein